MRSDMGRVVIERPRRGSSNPSLKARKVGRLHMDDADWQEWEHDGPCRVPNSAKMEGMWDKNIGTKDFTDVLGPVKGYLKKNVGRKWDDVYSELRDVLGSGSYPIRHVLEDHVLRWVDTTAYFENGKVYELPSTRHYGEFYVHPVTGVLCEEKTGWRWKGAWKRQKSRLETDRVKLDSERWFVPIDGVWYIGRYVEQDGVPTRERPPRTYGRSREYAFGRATVTEAAVDFPDYYTGNWASMGKTFRFCKIKQASRAELKKYDVRRKYLEQRKGSDARN